MEMKFTLRAEASLLHGNWRLKWIHTKHVVFWDEADKRGWLVNGTSALLHLVRGSLDISRTDEFNAISELKNRSNMKLKVYADAAEHYEEETSEADQIKTTTKTKQSYVLFQDLVSHILNILEKLIDHQVETSAQNGVSLKRHIRKRLEGWDYKDIARNRDPLYPRVATLHPIDSIGKSWVDLVEGIHAITLLGCGFGDLLDPVVSPNLSSDCVLVPKDCYYLTAAVSDLKDIMEDHGDPKSQPPRLCEGVYWHQDKTIFDECQSDPGKHQDLAQVLTSSKTTSRSSNTSRSMPPGGAVIFGHNSILKWFHHDDGGPSVSEEPDPRTPEDGLLKVGYSLRKYKDSGLGSSNSGASNSQSYSRARFPESPSVANDRNSLLEDQGSSTNDSEAPRRGSDDLHRPLPLRENDWKPDERHRQARYNARKRNR